MNGNSTGVVPTFELAGANNNNNGYAYPYPVYPMMGGYGNGGFGGYNGDFIWLILLFALFGNNGWGGFGGFGGGLGMTDGGLLGYAIGNNATKGDVSDGFNSLHLSNQLESNRDAINNLSTQLCGCCGDISNQISNSTANVTSAITNGFYNSEISANNRQMADMQQNYTNQLSTLQSFNGLERQLCECCADNRLATCQTQNIVQNEGNQTRFADANNTRDIIDSQTRGTQAILDKLCQLELDNVKLQVDAKNDKIADLQRELTMKDLQASQTAQNAFIANGFANEVDALYNRLANCPVPSTPVYGRTPIFTCPNNNGCGCGYNTTSQFI